MVFRSGGRSTTGEGAGHETTANMIGKVMAMLLSDRSRREALPAGRTLIRSAVEEPLRFDADPGFGMPRRLRRREGLVVAGLERCR